VYHPDQATLETDTDHTVMLGWLAPSLAASFPGLDVGLVAQFALVHDAPEVYAGDTPTLLITSAGQAAKEAREAAAVEQLATEFAWLPWFPATVREYESQRAPEARFVRAVDKILPKVVNLLERCHSLQEVPPDQLADAWARQREQISRYAGGEFPGLMDLYDEVVARVLRAHRHHFGKTWPTGQDAA
jgi:putative hydrolase of HD superfamily